MKGNRSWAVARAGIWAGAIALGTSGCFYDSNWGGARRAQVAAAQQATPAELHATPAERQETEVPQKKAVRVLKLRARATARYAAEIVDWPKQLAEVLDDASEILMPTLGVRLEMDETAAWVPRTTEDDLAVLLDDLALADPADRTEWVIGLVGSLPRAEESFHQLGMSRAPGKHLVIRAMNDVREYEAIERNFTELDAAERRRLYRARKRHKLATVLLHEIGHTLGVPHEVDATTIMHPRYGIRVAGFSEGAAALMRLSLEHRLEPAAQSERAFAEAFLAEVQHTSAGWVPAEREALIGRLGAAAAQRGGHVANVKPASVEQRSTGDTDALSTLTITDRNTFNRALDEQHAGRLREAWMLAKPLFTAYPDVYAIQDLRCQLATAAGGSWEDIKAECQRLMQLTKTLAGTKRGP